MVSVSDLKFWTSVCVCSIFDDIGDYTPSTSKGIRDKEKERYREREREKDREREREREKERERERDREEEKRRHSYFEKPRADDEVRWSESVLMILIASDYLCKTNNYNVSNVYTIFLSFQAIDIDKGKFLILSALFEPAAFPPKKTILF